MPSTTRRQVLATIGSASVALAGCLSTATPSGDIGPVDGDWPMDGADSGHTRSVGAGPTEPSTGWTTELDRVRAAGTPSVADGRLYVPVDAVSDTARHRYRLHALEAATGDERWQVPLRSKPNSPPAVGADRIVVSARRSTERGRIVGFRPRYGDEEWLYDVDARLTAPPTIDGVRVYVPDWDGSVHALSVVDGSVRWAREIGADGSGRSFASPVAVEDGTVYAGSQSGETGVVALDADSGDERWSRSTDVVSAGPVVDDDLVVVRTHGPVAAFDTDGTPRWTFNVPEDDWLPLALDDQHVYVPAGETLYAIDRGGEKAWTYDAADRQVGSPTVVGDEVLVREEDRLTALASDDGTERWSIDRDGTGRPVVTPEALFLAGNGAQVVGLGDG